MGKKRADVDDVLTQKALVSSVVAARCWGVSRQFVSKLIKNGQVPAVKIGTSVLIPREFVLAVAERGLPSVASPSAPTGEFDDLFRHIAKKAEADLLAYGKHLSERMAGRLPSAQVRQLDTAIRLLQPRSA